MKGRLCIIVEIVVDRARCHREKTHPYVTSGELLHLPPTMSRSPSSPYHHDDD
jgi:hypothetical protein